MLDAAGVIKEEARQKVVSVGLMPDDDFDKWWDLGKAQKRPGEKSPPRLGAWWRYYRERDVQLQDGQDLNCYGE